MIGSQAQAEPPFTVRRENDGEVVVIVVGGTVDIATAPELSEQLKSVPPDRKVVVDLCGTDFMDSTGLRALLAADCASRAGVRVACTPDGAIGRLFDVALAGAHLQMYGSRAEALASF